jgi:hypothetical protein
MKRRNVLAFLASVIQSRLPELPVCKPHGVVGKCPLCQAFERVKA